MYRRRFQRFAALLFIALLSACVGSFNEPFAPELGRRYLLTEDLVQTSRGLLLPGLFQNAHKVPYVMTQEQFRLLRSFKFPFPDNGKVVRGSRVRVEQMFVYDDLNGTTRHGKLLVNTSAGELFTAYCDWDYVEPKLKELD